MKSVYADPAYADVVQQMQATLAQLKAEFRDDDTICGKPIPERKPGAEAGAKKAAGKGKKN
jgi:hypothetical protein